MCFIVFLVNIVILIEQTDWKKPKLITLEGNEWVLYAFFPNLHNNLNISRW